MGAFLRNKLVLSAVFMMVFYQVLMIGVFMSGYSAMPKNMTKLPIAVVNEDDRSGAEFVEQMKGELPFPMVTGLSLSEAQRQLDDREVHLIIHIPADFTKALSEQGTQAKMAFYVNDSTPASVSSSMRTVAGQISDQVAKQVQSQSFEGLLQGMNVPADQAAQTVEGIMSKISPEIVSTNTPPSGMHNQMAPMFLTMATYVGAMIYSMMSVSALNQNKASMGKRKAFLSLQGVNVVLSLFAPLVGVSVYFCVQGYGGEAFFKVWLVHALEMFTAIEFTSIFCMLFGQGGMLLNLPILLSQTIAGGAVLPREMMPGFFEAVSYVTPMFYTIQLDYNVLFGGGQSSRWVAGLALVGAGALLINAVIHALKPLKAKGPAKEAVPQPLTN